MSRDASDVGWCWFAVLSLIEVVGATFAAGAICWSALELQSRVSSLVYVDAVVVHMDADAQWSGAAVCLLQNRSAFWCDGSKQLLFDYVPGKEGQIYGFLDFAVLCCCVVVHHADLSYVVTGLICVCAGCYCGMSGRNSDGSTLLLAWNAALAVNCRVIGGADLAVLVFWLRWWMDPFLRGIWLLIWRLMYPLEPGSGWFGSEIDVARMASSILGELLLLLNPALDLLFNSKYCGGLMQCFLLKQPAFAEESGFFRRLRC
ncbi:hypothetical protein Nepgr_027276 [Nepenthes gracilis]|uniref:Uncharacterized protein n=1 Tax=Nepenthes gracilis TaxID=150966 RepID=A0AAD3TA31_NEPGR|nr:hypothetical protein Nepgr_027276 [Nepenthes gracilis]